MGDESTLPLTTITDGEDLVAHQLYLAKQVSPFLELEYSISGPSTGPGV